MHLLGHTLIKLFDPQIVIKSTSRSIFYHCRRNVYKFSVLYFFNWQWQINVTLKACIVKMLLQIIYSTKECIRFIINFKTSNIYKLNWKKIVIIQIYRVPRKIVYQVQELFILFFYLLSYLWSNFSEYSCLLKMSWCDEIYYSINLTSKIINCNREQ